MLSNDKVWQDTRLPLSLDNMFSFGTTVARSSLFVGGFYMTNVHRVPVWCQQACLRGSQLQQHWKRDHHEVRVTLEHLCHGGVGLLILQTLAQELPKCDPPRSLALCNTGCHGYHLLRVMWYHVLIWLVNSTNYGHLPWQNVWETPHTQIHHGQRLDLMEPRKIIRQRWCRVNRLNTAEGP